MEIVKSFKDKVLSTWNKQKSKKILKNTQKIQKKKLFYFKFKFNSNIIFYLKNCSCKSNLKYLIQLDNKFDSSFRVIRTFINSVQYINKNHKKKNYFFSRKIAKKNGSLRSFKNSEILTFLTLSSLNLTHMQTKTPLTLPFILFPLQRKKYILQK